MILQRRCKLNLTFTVGNWRGEHIHEVGEFRDQDIKINRIRHRHCKESSPLTSSLLDLGVTEV